MKKITLALFSMVWMTLLFAQSKPQIMNGTTVAKISNNTAVTATKNSGQSNGAIFNNKPSVNKADNAKDYCGKTPSYIDNGLLKVGTAFNPGSQLNSANKVYHLIFAKDGSTLILFDNIKLDGQYMHSVWKAPNIMPTVSCGAFTNNGTLTLYHPNGSEAWTPIQPFPTGKAKKKIIALQLTNDGSLIMLDDNQKQVDYIYLSSNKSNDPATGVTIYNFKTGNLWPVQTKLKPNEGIKSYDGSYTLLFRDGGIEYLKTADINSTSIIKPIIWQTKKFANAQGCSFGGKGDMVIFGEKGDMVWSTNTYAFNGNYFGVYDGWWEIFTKNGNSTSTIWRSDKGFSHTAIGINELKLNESINIDGILNNRPLIATNGNRYAYLHFYLGNINVVTEKESGGDNKIVWTTNLNVAGAIAKSISLLPNGLFIYDQYKKVLWHTNNTKDCKALYIDPNGKLEIHNSKQETIWSSTQ